MGTWAWNQSLCGMTPGLSCLWIRGQFPPKRDHCELESKYMKGILTVITEGFNHPSGRKSFIFSNQLQMEIEFLECATRI